MLGKTNSVEDLKNFDPEYYENLTSLRKLSAADIESAGLTFELTIGDSGDNNMPSSGQAAGGSSGSTDPYASLTSKMQTIELVPGGRDKAVTKQNVIQYIHLVAHYRLNIQAYHQTRAFLRGFRDLIPASWVRLFSANELQKLIGGDDSIRGIDVAALKRSMQYAGGYHPSQPVVHDFWDLLQNDFTPDQQKKFLKFMTSCSRQPLLGFGSLEPAPCIQQIRLPEGADKEQSRLPTSATCFNLLKLPNYGSKNLLRKKLLAAIESGAGFELT
uniref:HECT-type E3 ubiquitin transferase n=1 Tax=Craspedostauros australis TaxID=1486917 RepID=A0A7R9ZRY8_9STRA